MVALLGGAAALAAVAQSARSAPYPDTQALLNPPDGEWLNYGRDHAGTHHSPLDQITPENVDQLGLAWSYDTNSYPGQLEGTPLMADGTIYGTLTWSVVFAIDARTGEEKWRWDPEIPQQQWVTDSRGINHRRGPSLCCGPVNRGVALYEDKVFVGTLQGGLVALDADTGVEVWSTQVTHPEDDYSITGAPRIVDGLVIIGNSGAEFGVRGFVSAYDADTGDLVWRFYTVPGDPTRGFENAAMERAAETWTGTWWRYGGGGTVWDGMAYDPELDLLYFGVGNGAPWPRDIRSPAGGDNLYLTSIMALRPQTGEYVWHYQTTPGDDWDYAATQPLVLADLVIDGRERKVIMQAPKNGIFVVIDRETGEFISGEPFANITWATGVDPETGRPIESSFARYGIEGAEISPGSDGAANWHSTAWSPETGLIFIPGSETSRWFSVAEDFAIQPGEIAFGMGRRRPRPAQPEPEPVPEPEEEEEQAPPTPRPPRIDPQVVGLGGSGGFLTAVDPVTQEERWRIDFGRPGITGGTLTTASGLLFHGSSDGVFSAYRAADGEKLWEVELAPGFANPMTYMLDGRQYVTIVTGRSGTHPAGRVYTFALGTDSPLPPMAAVTPPPLPAVEPPPDGFLGGMAGAELPDIPGREIVQQTCTQCHTVDRIVATRRTETEWQLLVQSKLDRGFIPTTTPEERAAIVDYLVRALGRG
ncbi:MAG: PQQ-dependent dehydrogenase, methanol/ethanol family [Gemmatimonadota bacterium]